MNYLTKMFFIAFLNLLLFTNSLFASKIIIKQLKNGEQVINNVIDVVTNSTRWDGQKLLALTPNGEMELRYVDEIYDANNNQVGKLYEYGTGEPVIIGNNKETVIKSVIGGIYSNFTKVINFGGDILKTPGKKINILGRVGPKNGSIGTQQLFNELKLKGIPESELTGLFTPMPSTWNNLSVPDMNLKYWNEINKVHIDNIIANGGDIRFIHDPRLIENQVNYVADMLEGPFKQKCISENITSIPTFMKWEYDYLLSKGYVLQETGLMIKL